MKVYTPEISWHERDPIYTCAYHPINPNKLATSGVTGCIRLWEIGEKLDTNTINKKNPEEIASKLGSPSDCDVKFIANLKRHCKSVNVIRWNHDGQILASAGDESCIFLWKENEIKNQKTLDMDEDENKENWFSFKTFRGHLEDILDLSWSKDGTQIISGSIDNSVIVWDVNTGNKLCILKEPKGFVQGVVYDPLGLHYCCLSTDRSLRIFTASNHKCILNVSKMQMSKETVDPMPPCIRIFHDDTMKSFFRRMCYTSDGNLLLAPSGCLEIENNTINCSYIFTRNSYAKPALYIPHDRPSIAISCCPLKYELRTKTSKSPEKIDNLFDLPYRYIFAIATEDSVYIYDTQNLQPFSYVTGIHYSNLSDLSWSSDGRMICVTSIDGFCSFVIFDAEPLGKVYTDPIVEEEPVEQNNAETGINKSEIKGITIKAKLLLAKTLSKEKLTDKKICNEIDISKNDLFDNETDEVIMEQKMQVLTEQKEENTNILKDEKKEIDSKVDDSKVEVKTLEFNKKDESVKTAGANKVKRLKLLPL